jgi:hypothetical protein
MAERAEGMLPPSQSFRRGEIRSNEIYIGQR